MKRLELHQLGIQRQMASAVRPLSPPPSPVFETTSSPSDQPRTRLEGDALVILDWDNTLLPTAWLGSKPISPRIRTRVQPRGSATSPIDLLPPGCRHELGLLEAEAIAFVEACSAHGHVVIVTNSADGWVQTSGTNFAPKLLAHITERKIPVLSARALFSPTAVLRGSGSGSVQTVCGLTMNEDPTTWKRDCFLSLAREFAKTRLSILQLSADDEHRPPEGLVGESVNLLSIGDAEYERESAHYAGEALVSAVGLTKTVKLIDEPTVSQVRTRVFAARQQCIHKRPVLLGGSSYILALTFYWVGTVLQLRAQLRTLTKNIQALVNARGSFDADLSPSGTMGPLERWDHAAGM